MSKSMDCEFRISSHREDEVMLELLEALDFSRNLDGVSKQNEVVEGLSFEHDGISFHRGNVDLNVGAAF